MQEQLVGRIFTLCKTIFLLLAMLIGPKRSFAGLLLGGVESLAKKVPNRTKILYREQKMFANKTCFKSNKKCYKRTKNITKEQKNLAVKIAVQEYRQQL